MKEYKAIGSYSNRELEKKINDLARQGYKVCKLSNGGDGGFYVTVIMERNVKKVRENNEK